MAHSLQQLWLIWARSSCTHRRRRRVRRSWRSIAFSKKSRDFEQLHRHLSSRSGEAIWLAVSSKQSNRLIAVFSYAYTFASLVRTVQRCAEREACESCMCEQLEPLQLRPVHWRLHGVHNECWGTCGGLEKHGSARGGA